MGNTWGNYALKQTIYQRTFPKLLTESSTNVPDIKTTVTTIRAIKTAIPSLFYSIIVK